MSLTELEINAPAHIVSVKAGGNMRRRLFDLGFAPGSEVICTGKSLFGNPRAYLIKGSIIALRRSESDKIYIEKSLG